MGHRDRRERRRPIARMTAARNASTGRPSIARLALVGALDPLAAPFGRVEDRGEERLRMPDAPVLELEDLDHVPARAVRVARSEDARVDLSGPADSKQRLRGREDPAVLTADDALDLPLLRAAGVVRQDGLEVGDATDPLPGLRPGLLELRVQDLVERVHVAAIHQGDEALEGRPRVEFGHILRSRLARRRTPWMTAQG